MGCADLRQPVVIHDEIVVATERRVGHDGQIMLLTPRQHVALNAAVVEAVWDLIGCAAVAYGNAEQLFHLCGIEIGYAPGTNLPS